MSWPSWLSRPKLVPVLLGLMVGILGGLALGFALRATGTDITTAYGPWAFIGGAVGVGGVLGYYRAK